MGNQILIEPALEGYPVAWGSPTYKMLIEAWKATRRTLAPVTVSANASEHRIELITGGVIEMWSLENFDSIRGRKYKKWVIDEAAMVPNLGEAWQAVIRPTLSDYEGGAWFLSTPRGRNFFWQCFQRGVDPNQPDWAAWQMPTASNPFIKPDEIEAARLELPERVFQQEYLAEFLADAGGVFLGVRDVATAQRQQPGTGHTGRFVIGVDWGKSNDFTVLSVIDARTGVMVDMESFNRVGWAVQRARLVTMAEKWKPWLILAEENSIGSPNVEALQAEGLPVIGFQTTASSKGPLIEALALAIERRAVTLLNVPELINQLEAYEMRRNEITGRLTYSAPQGQHDDMVIATALAWLAAQTPTNTGHTVDHRVRISTY